MALASDKDGFLIGDTPANIDKAGMSRTLAIWKAIKDDTAAIRKALTGLPVAMQGRKNQTRQNNVIAFPARAAGTTQPRDALGRFMKATTPTQAQTKAIAETAARAVTGKAAVPTPNNAAAQAAQKRAQEQARGDDGRFGAGDKKKGGVAGATESAIVAGGEAFSKFSIGAEEVDPNIKATREIADLIGPALKPLAKGTGFIFNKIFRRNKKEEEDSDKKVHVPWYKRIWKELKDLNEKRTGGGGLDILGSLWDGVKGLFSNIGGALKSALLTLLAPLAGGLSGVLPFLAKLALPVAALFSAVKSFATSTEDYAKRLGVEAGQGFFSDLAIRFVGVLGDLGNTITFGLAEKFGELISPAIASIVDGIINVWSRAVSKVNAVFGKTLYEKEVDRIAAKKENAGAQVTAALSTMAKARPESDVQSIYNIASSTPGFADMTPQEQINVINSASATYIKQGTASVAPALFSPGGGRHSASSATPVFSSGASAAMPTMNVPNAPAIRSQVNTPKTGGGKLSVNINQPVGQNVGDRAIAQIVTGGMGGYMGS